MLECYIKVVEQPFADFQNENDITKNVLGCAILEQSLKLLFGRTWISTFRIIL